VKNTTKLRKMLREPGIIVAPGCIDPFTAKIIESLGFRCVCLGGYATGCHLVVPEPLLTMTEQVAYAGQVAASVDIPLITDAGAGGDAIHTARSVREFERAGVSGIHIEDQVFPKKMKYHTLPLPKEKIIPAAEMVDKLKGALDARTDPDFVIIARTDAVHADGGGIDLAIERANIYAETGVDMIMGFPNDMKEAERFAREVKAPTYLVYSEGVPRPQPSIQEADRLGYKGVCYPSTVIMTVFEAVRDAFTTLRDTGVTGNDLEHMMATRAAVQATIKIPELIERERRSSEVAAAARHP
jgi:methylisocitrate lyase